MILPKIGDSFTRNIGSDSSTHVVMVDSNNNVVYHFDETGEPHLNFSYQLPPDYVDKLTNARINDDNDEADVIPLGAAYGWLTPFNSPQGLVFPYYDREGIVKLYRRVNEDWVSDASYSVGTSINIAPHLLYETARNLHRFAGCYYNTEGGTPRFMYLVSDSAPSTVTNTSYVGATIRAYDSANHTDISSAVNRNFPTQISTENFSNFGPVSITQVGASGTEVMFAITMYSYITLNEQLTGSRPNLIAVPGAIQQSRSGIQNTCLPSVLFITYDTATNQFVLAGKSHFYRRYALPPSSTGTAYGNYAFPMSTSSIVVPVNAADNLKFYRPQAANGRLTLHTGTFNAAEFQSTQPATHAENVVNDEQVIIDSSDISINTMKVMTYQASQASKSIRVSVDIISTTQSVEETLYTQSNPFTTTKNNVRAEPKTFGFIAGLESKDVIRFDPNWTMKLNGFVYKPVSMTQVTDNRVTAVFELNQ